MRLAMHKEKVDMRRYTAGGALTGLSILLVCLLFGPSTPSSWAAESFKMGVVDPQEVLERSKAGRRELDRLREYTAARQRILNNDEQELKKLEEEFKGLEGRLTEEQKQDKQNQFRAKVQDYQRRLQEFNQELAAKQKEMVADYMKKIGAATKTVAVKNGFTLVVDKGSDSTIKIVIYNKDALDLTDEVIAEFDRQNK